MFDRLGELVSRRWLLVLLGWAALVVGIDCLAPRWDEVTRDGDFAYLPSEMTSVRGQKLLQAAFPNLLSKSNVVLVVARDDGRLRGPDFAVAEKLLEEFTPKSGDDSPIVEVRSYQSPVIGSKLISREGKDVKAVLIALRLRNEFMAVDNMALIRKINGRLDAIRAEKDFPRGLGLGITGSAAVGSDMLESAKESIDNTELTTIILVVVILLLVYRAPGLAFVPLATIGVSVIVAMDLVAILAQLSQQLEWVDFKVFKTTRIFIVVVLFGSGTDYCLFLISRYREELRRGLDCKRAISMALGRVGKALAASALTTIVGLGTMFFADFGKFSNSGPAIALCLCVALAASVTLAPALLRATGRRVFWPFGPGRSGGHAEAGTSSLAAWFWHGLSRRVIAHPGLIMVLSLLLMSPLVYAGLRVPITYDLLGELQADRPSVQGTRLLQRHFVTAEIDPVTVLAHSDKLDFRNEQGEAMIALLTKDLFNFEYVDTRGRAVEPIVSVRSLSEPLGDKPGSFSFFSAAGRDKLMVLRRPDTKALYRSEAEGYAGRVARFELVFRYPPFSRESTRVLHQVQQRLTSLAAGNRSVWPDELPPDQRKQLLDGLRGTTFVFTGTTAGIRDLEAVTSSDQVLIQSLVVIAVLFVLILILRRPIICIYLILSVLLGYFVTIGATEVYFSWLYADTFRGLDWKVPIFLFVLLIALGADYNIYLATRVLEEQRRRGLLEGLRVALIRTGGIITSCGVIMAGTFASMTTGTLRAMHELGFALALGVLLDTFIIRTILVPAFLAMLARRGQPSRNTP